MKKFLKNASAGTLILLIVSIFFLAVSFCQFSVYNRCKEIGNAIELKDGKLKNENEDKTVIAYGSLKILKNPVDNVTGVTVDGFALIRTVKMYQYDISNDLLTCTFSDEQLKNIKGKGGEYYENPVFPEDLHSEIFLADVGFENGLKISPDYVSSISEKYPYFTYTVSSKEFTDLPEFENEYGLIPKIKSYSSVSGDSAKVGDIEITYTYIPKEAVKELTVYGKQKDGYIVTDNLTFASMTDKIADADELRELLAGSNLSSFKFFLFLFFVCIAIFVIKYCLKRKISAGKASAAVFAALLIVSSFPFTLAKADFGDYGGDFDYGGYDSYDYDFGNDYDYDYDDGGNVVVVETTTSSYYSYDDYPDRASPVYVGEISYRNTAGRIIDVKSVGSVISSTDTFSLGFSFFAAVAGIIAVLIKKGKKNSYSGPRPKGAVRTSASALRSMNEYIQLDEDFDNNGLCQKISDMYCQFQHSWQKKDMDDLRPYLTDAFYAQCNLQLDNYIRNSQTNIIDDINVENVMLVGWKQDGENDIIIASVQAVIRDYVIDDNTGNFIRGNKDKLRRMCYEWTLVRATGKKTGESLPEDAVCPHCGAPLTINAASQCEYCDSIIETEASDWAVSGIKGISQITLQ